MNQGRKASLVAICMIISLISFFAIEACYDNVQASSFLWDKSNQKVILLLADGISIEDFKEDPYLTDFFNNSYSAFISARQTGKATAERARLALGAGKRLLLANGMTGAFQQQKGIQLPKIENIKELNQEEGFGRYVGYLGTILHQNNRHTGLIGNSDGDQINRSAALLVTDQKGEIDFGEVDHCTIRDDAFPGGKRTDYDKLLKLYGQYGFVDLLAIDLGDLSRLDEYRTSLAAQVFEEEKAKTIERISAFVKEITSRMDSHTSLVVLSAFASKRDIQAGFKLTPMLVYNGREKGMLYSDSTKRGGILVNTDVADYILQKLQLKEQSNISEKENASNLWKMSELQKRLRTVSKMRLPVLTWYAVFEIVCAVLGLGCIILLPKKKKSLLRAIKIVLLANIVAPAVLLYMAGLDINSFRVYFCLFILFSLLTGALIFFAVQNEKLQFLLAALLVNGSLSVDLLRGSALIKNSVFGYDPIIGARFYGIGNEFAGVFIGSGLLLLGCLMQYFSGYAGRRTKRSIFVYALYTALQLSLMGLPNLGANFGGTIAAICGYFFFFLAYGKKKLRLRQLLGLAAAISCGMFIIIMMDFLMSRSMSHVGRFVVDIKDNGIQVLYATFARKLTMNLRLMKYTIWTKVLLCIILIITIMFFKPVRLLKDIFYSNSSLSAAWLGISAGSIAGLIVNDSGIVMAATAMIFTGYTILYMCLREDQT